MPLRQESVIGVTENQVKMVIVVTEKWVKLVIPITFFRRAFFDNNFARVGVEEVGNVRNDVNKL